MSVVNGDIFFFIRVGLIIFFLTSFQILLSEEIISLNPSDFLEIKQFNRQDNVFFNLQKDLIQQKYQWKAEKFYLVHYQNTDNRNIINIATQLGISVIALLSLNKLNIDDKLNNKIILIPSIDGFFRPIPIAESYRQYLFDYYHPQEKYIQIEIHLDEKTDKMKIYPNVVFNSKEIRYWLESLPFIYPLSEKYQKDSSRYGFRKNPLYTKRFSFHSGLDIAAPQGTPIHASQSGKVITLVSLDRIYGNYLVIKHRKKFTTLYAHMKTFKVKLDQLIQQNQIIGTVGNTGQSTGPHLHFSLTKDGLDQNPLAYLFKLK